ncbi:nucleoside hydrolase [Pyxidicoccus sp. 3LG]
MANRIPVLIDTDFALDDWMAILYLLMNPAVEVIGITTTGVGASHLGPATTNVLDLLAYAGRPDIPVASGTNAPLSYSNVFPGDWRQQVDSTYGIPFPRNPNGPQPLSAVEFLTRTLRHAKTPVTILSIGGATNLAMLFESAPNVAANIAGIYVMGGALQAPGNVQGFNPDYNNTVAEWNIFIDVLAAQRVFQNKLRPSPPITLVPLDASNCVPLDIAFYSALMWFVANPTSEAPRAALTAIFAGLSTQLSSITATPSTEYFFWDPLAAVVLTDSQVVLTTQRTPLTVAQQLNESQDTSGRTEPTSSGPNINVVMTVDPVRVKVRFLATIAGVSEEKAARVLGMVTPGSASAA